MTAELIARPRVSRRSSILGAVPAVPASMLALVLARLVFVTRPPTPDEAGFLVVGSQWHVGGTSLYGNYWVDRPPLLIWIFRIADLAGGLTALRVIGALAAAATVALLAATARRAFGRPAATPTALVAAGLLVTPLYGSLAVNGELLAAPFIALGLRLVVEAVEAEDPLAVRGAALGAGFAAALALLVKQNMADVVVFALACWVVAWRTRRVTRRTLADLVALAAVGGAVGYAVVMLWAMAHGTSPLGVYEATYPFRIHAGQVLSQIPGNTADLRLSRLGASAVLSGALLVLVAFGVLVVRRALRGPVVWALVVSGAFAVASILAGGSYWLHYLVQTVPVVALAAGAIAAAPNAAEGRRRWVERWSERWAAGLSGIVAASAVVALAVSLIHPAPDPGSVVGKALAGSTQPGDTVLSAFGDADILRATGMTSPYPYLWSLPSRTLDPDMALLRGLLAGPDAPTWIVVRGSGTMARLGAHGVAAMIQTRYRVVGDVCGRSIYLLKGLSRPTVDTGGECGGLVLP